MRCRTSSIRIALAFTLLTLLRIAVPAPSAEASCGAEMCTLELRGPEASLGRYSIEFAYQHINQDDVRVGTEPGFVGEIPGHHNEIQTETDGWSMTGRAFVSPLLSLSATLPYMNRMHRHEHEHAPGVYEEVRWDYSGFGDLMLLSYWSPRAFVKDPYALALQAGVKLPTGRKNVPEVDGEQPEPMARPSTGSFDVMAGVQVRRTVNTRTFSGETVPVPFAIGVTGRLNGHGTQEYQAGHEFLTNLSGGWALTPAVTFLGQVNLRIRGEDDPGTTGDEPGNTGGTAIYGTPGLRVAFGRAAAYGYYQMRLYENVNGIQITSPAHLMVGMNYLF
jgi:hypothetical protein